MMTNNSIIRHDAIDGSPVGQPYTLPHQTRHGVLGVNTSEEFLRRHGSYPCVQVDVPDAEEERAEFVADQVIVYRHVPPPPPHPLAGYEAEAQGFAEEWAKTKVPMTDDWQAAISGLEDKAVPQAVINKLLAYRMALAPVWDSVLAFSAS